MRVWFLFFLLLAYVGGSAQNIFDYAHSIAYTKHLYEHKDFKQALATLKPCDSAQNKKEVLVWRVKCYLQLKHYDSAMLLLQNPTFIDKQGDGVYQFLYLKTKLLKKDFNSTHLQYLDTSNLLIAELLCYIQFYTQTYDSTISYVKNTISNPSLRQYMMDLLEKSKYSYAYKKPWLAASLSIIPGLGQIYTKQYADSYLGVLPFYLHGSIAYLSFSQAGVQSIFGWVNMALASGFYVGNIYGAGQSAKRINQINYKKTVHEIEERIASLEF